MRLILILLSAYFLVFPFGQLVKFTQEPPEINFHLADILVGLTVLVWLLYKLGKREKFLWPSLTKPILLFFFIGFISLFLNSSFDLQIKGGENLSGRELFVSWLYLFRWIFYAGLYFLAYDLGQKIGKLSRGAGSRFAGEIGNWLMSLGLTVAILGLIQYLFLPDTRFLENYGWDPHYFRVIGTFLDPGFLGVILVLTLILLTLKLWPARNKWQTAAWLSVYLALALTYSRASYLSYLGAMGTIAYFKRSPKFFLGILAALIITIFLLPRPGGEGVRLERESTIRFRLINWQQSLTIAFDHPLFGVGFNAYRYTQRDYGFLEFANWRASHAGGGADSSFLFVLATTGVFGFLIYLWLWGKSVFWAVKRKNIIILGSLSALFIHSIFANSLFYPWIMAWWWLLAGAEEAKD